MQGPGLSGLGLWVHVSGSLAALSRFCFSLHSLAALGQGHAAGEWEEGNKVPFTPPDFLLRCGLFD